MRKYFLFFNLEFLKNGSSNCTYNIGILLGRIKTSTVTVIPIPGIETSVISVIHKEFVQVKFQVVSS